MVIGSLASSKVVDTTDHMVVMGISIIICGAGIWFVPYCSSIYTVAALISGLGLSVGIVDTAGFFIFSNFFTNFENFRKRSGTGFMEA